MAMVARLAVRWSSLCNDNFTLTMNECILFIHVYSVEYQGKAILLLYLIFQLTVSDFPCLSRLDSLRQKLESEGLRDVAYMVINHQGARAQNLHAMLAERLSENIALYKQNEQQTDVWQTLSGEKDDFLIYDRFVTCGALFTFCKKNQNQIFFFNFTDNAFHFTCDQMWPPHPPHFTSILHHQCRPRGGCNQRYLLQTYLWRVHIWGIGQT